MGKILEYPNLGGAPAQDDLLFLGDYSADNANPVTKHVLISDLNKKYQIWAADNNGLKITDDSGAYGLFVKDNGGSGLSNIGIGTNAASYLLDVQGSTVNNANIRIYSSVANSYPSLKLQNDATTWSIYCNGNYTDAVRTDIFLIEGPGGGSGPFRLFMQKNGNVGIGHNGSLAATGAEYDLDVKGDFCVKGSYPVIIDSARGEIKQLQTTGGVGTTNSLHVQYDAGANIDFMYNGGGANAGMRIQTDRKIVIGQTTARAKLHIVDATAGTNFLVQDSTNGSVIELRRDSGTTTTNSLYLTTKTAGTGAVGVGDPTTTPGAATINFNTSGFLDIGATGYAYKFNAYDASNNIVGRFQSNQDSGARLLLTTGTNNAAAAMSSVIAFPIYVSSSPQTNWMCGAFRNGGNNYFGIHHSTSSPATPGNVAVNSTLADNKLYLDTSGNLNVYGNAAANAFYDKGGTSAGNYCRGRFTQTFSFPYYFETVNQRWSPLFAAPYDTTNNYHGSSAPDKQFASLAPMGGRITRIDVSLNMSTPSNVVKAYIFTGSSMPSSNKLSTSDSAYKENIDLSSAASNSFTLGFDDFAASASTGGQTNLDFSQGEFLMLGMDTNTGNGKCNVTVTVEFDVPDSLGA